jgi:RND superfamily putative drug exporter
VEALSNWVTRHRLMVGLLWLAITVVGVVLAPSVSGRLTGGNHMNSPAVTANEQIGKQYAGATVNPGVILLDLPAGQTVTSPGVSTKLNTVDAAMAGAIPSIRTLSFASTVARPWSAPAAPARSCWCIRGRTAPTSTPMR